MTLIADALEWYAGHTEIPDDKVDLLNRLSNDVYGLIAHNKLARNYRIVPFGSDDVNGSNK